MKYQFAKNVVVGGFLLVLWKGIARAQMDAAIDPSTYSHDMQLFAPAETDLDGLIIGQENRAGVFFAWDKTYMTTTGELVTVGDPKISRALPPVWMDRLTPDNPLTLLPGLILPGLQPINPVTGRPRNPDTLPALTYIERPVYINSIQEVVPDASFRAADRYEFGYNYEDHGWLVTVIDGPEQQGNAFFGLLGGLQADQGGGTLISPLGDVYVQFDYEPGLMHGFQDLWQATILDPDGNVLPDDANGDGILDGDGFADDLDGDGQYGPHGYDVNAPALEPDSFPQPAGPPAPPFPATASGPPDYDDLVELPTSFQSVFVRNAATTNGVEVMAMHRLNNRHWQAKHKNYNNIELYYGARYLRFRDNFVVNGEGGVLGLSTWDTQIINNVIGPQVALRWTHTRGRWSTNMNGRFTFGYNVSNWDQSGFIGEDLIPGANNHPLYLRPKSFKYGRRDDDFSPIAEMRMEVAYNFTRSVALKAGWTGMYVGNIYRASTHVKYRLPDMGFIVGNPEHVIVHGATGGLEFNY